MKKLNYIKYMVAIGLLYGSTHAMALTDENRDIDSSQFLLNIPAIVNDINSEKWLPYLAFGGYYFNDNPHGRAEASVFLPFNHSGRQLFYGSIRTYDRNSPQFEGNFALGYRRLFTGVDSACQQNYCDQTYDKMVGFYTSYDLLRSESSNWFNQFTVGGEYWYQRFFIGANGYVPFIRTVQHDSSSSLGYGTHPQGSDQEGSGVYGHIFYANGRETALPGVDGEVGYNVIAGLTLYGGGYYYHRSGSPTLSGPKGRVEYIFYPNSNYPLVGLLQRITLQAQVQHDNPRGTTWYSGLSLTFHLVGGSYPEMEGVERHMVDPIRRDKDIITEHYHTPIRELMINGHVANVEYVNNNEAVQAAANDMNADVIAVNGTINNVSTLTLANGHDVVLTGGDFHYQVGDDTVTVNNLGHNGKLVASADNSQQELIRIADGNANLTIENIALQTNPNDTHEYSSSAISNYQGKDGNGNDVFGGFGTLTLDNVQSSGALTIKIPAGKVGVISVENSDFDITKWSQAQDVRHTSGSVNTGIIFETNGGILTISHFDHNRITVSGKTDDTVLFGMQSTASNGGTLIYENDFSYNQINAIDSAVAGQAVLAMQNTANPDSQVIFAKNFERNTISVKKNTTAGNNSIGINNFANGGKVTFSGNFDNNSITMNDTASYHVYGIINQVKGAGNIEYKGNFSSNTIAAKGANTVYGIINSLGASSTGSIKLYGIFSDNAFSVSSSGGKAYNVKNSKGDGATGVINFPLGNR